MGVYIIGFLTLMYYSMLPFYIFHGIGLYMYIHEFNIEVLFLVDIIYIPCEVRVMTLCIFHVG